MGVNIRCFLAINLPEKTKIQILDFSKRLNFSSDSWIKWVGSDNLHITLKFIPQFNSEDQILLKSCLESSLCSISNFTIEINKLGAFPNLTNPRVIWLGFCYTEELSIIFKESEKCFHRLGYPMDRKPFFPHLTIGRIKTYSSPNEFEKIRGLFTSSFSIFSIDSFTQGLSFFHSELTPKGPVYSSLFDIPLSSSSSLC